MFRELLFVVSCLFLMVVSIGVVTYASMDYSCGKYEEMTGKKTTHIAFDSCYIETSEGWQRWDEYKARAFGNESGDAE